MREEHRREQARDASRADLENEDLMDVYNRTRNANIPTGKPLFFAGANHEFCVKEV